MSTRLILALALLIAPLAATADRPAQYWGITLDGAELTHIDGDDSSATNLGLLYGYRFSDFLGVEVQGGASLNGADVGYIGAFGRFDLPYDRINVYLLAGGAAVAFDDGAPRDWESESDLAAGIGIELFGTERTALRLQYMRYADDTYETIGLGFVQHFNWPRFR